MINTNIDELVQAKFNNGVSGGVGGISSKTKKLIKKQQSPQLTSIISNSKGSPGATSSLQVLPLKLTPLERIHFTSKLLENNDDLTLNCIQLINFIEFYFNDEADESTATALSTSRQQQSLAACFPCIVCSMQFSFDQTFHMHLERKSIVIRVYCVKCESLKKFYNKCKLLYHVYSHKMTLFEPIYKSIQIESFQAASAAMVTSQQSLLIRERTIDIDLIFANAYQSVFNERDSSSNMNVFNNGFKMCENDLMQAQLFAKRLALNNFLIYKCHVCDAIFFHLKDLKIHYANSQRLEFASNETTNATLNYLSAQAKKSLNNQQNGKTNVNRAYFQMLKQKHSILCNETTENKKVFKNFDMNSVGEDKLKEETFVSFINSFSFKKLQFSNRCYTLASSNLLANSSSYFNSQKLMPSNDINILICPECGMSFDSRTQANSFRMHLIYECLFSIKYNPPQIKCPSSLCEHLFDTLDETAIHWMTSHVLKLQQCELCERKGVKHFFNESYSVDNMENSLSHSNSENNVLDSTDDADNSIKSLSSATLSQINKHYFEKHRNQPISVKPIYKCSCKTLPNLAEPNLLSNDANRECLSNRLEIIQKHSFNIVAKSINSISCLLCKKLTTLEEYQIHMNMVHSKEKFYICPICGIVKNESSLHNHILRFHHDLNSKSNPSSCFFNLSNSLSKPAVLDKGSKKKSTSNDNNFSTMPKLTNGSSHDQSLVNGSSSNDLFIYQCVNCRLFFTSNSSFSHNCLVTVVDKQPPTYFSPIYLKFNLSNFMSNSKILSSTNTLNSSNSTFQIVNSSELNSQNNNDSLILNIKRVKIDASNQFSSNQINV